VKEIFSLNHSGRHTTIL